MSKKVIIYMNEQLHARVPKHGVMTVQHGSAKWYTNEIDLKLSISAKVYLRQDEGITVAGRKIRVLYKPELCSDVKSHEVKAWIEVT